MLRFQGEVHQKCKCKRSHLSGLVQLLLALDVDRLSRTEAFRYLKYPARAALRKRPSIASKVLEPRLLLLRPIPENSHEIITYFQEYSEHFTFGSVGGSQEDS